MIDPTIPSAFILGFASFFISVCILPLIPAFLTFLAGSSIQEVKENPIKARTKIFLNTIMFVLGFSIVFSLLGVLLQSVLSGISYDLKIYLGWIFGSTIILFGLMMIGLIKIPALEVERRIRVKKGKYSYISSFIFGVAFAVGWTPCSAPILGTILSIAILNPVNAFPLMLAYSLGLSLPFLIMGLFISRASNFIAKITPYMKTLNIIFGIIIVILGILIFTNTLAAIVSYFIPANAFLN